MKAILTIIAIIFFGTLATAQDFSKEVKVETTTVGVELNIEIQETQKETEVARLYMFKNSRVKKALSFRTKRNKSKLA
ncbi:hypothetical protein FVB32_11010 [Flagellimonas hymeniacidonis]|uniref:Uncharacterized protein n=1 Tax=Flagellimonas hymeniacidonis TaxID=2603628 RepID=A0A5C8V0U4_9FLAO|nr:hypothetical protein [Flagellimonas hymeniacidonis]TXN35114.1 hypothetical protein FVB32_11010 [Flagellimonas hymeniacidonis]